MDLGDISFIFIRGLQDKRSAGKCRMKRDPLHRLHAKVSLAQFLVPVLVRSPVVLTVIEVYRLQAIQSDHIIKMLQHAVQIIHEIISGIPGVAGIKADTDLLLTLHPVDDLPELFKCSSDLRPLNKNNDMGVNKSAATQYLWALSQ